MPRFYNLPYYILYFFTWPYYGTLMRYTIQPLKRIAVSQKDLLSLGERVQDFALGKGTELKYVSFAATINAALTVVTFSWPRLDGAPWAALALLYTSLFFVIGALVTGSQHIMFFYKMCPSPNHNIASGPCDAAAQNIQQFARACWRRAKDHLVQRYINPNIILIWQSPIALMAWSWVAFAVAIVVLIARPFVAPANGDTDEHKTAIFALTAGAVIIVAFLWSSWFTYEAGRGVRSISPYGPRLPLVTRF
ncbi:hypothetical protein BDV06DRAFT_209073 [Aspergillus oleicola]